MWPRSNAGLEHPQALQGVGTAVQSTVVCRRWLFDFDFYRAGFDINS